MTRSIFLPHESYTDVQTALAKAGTEEERHHLISERLKANGWTREKELNYRRHCEVIGFSLGFQRARPNPLEKNAEGGHQARLLANSIRTAFRKSETSE